MIRPVRAAAACKPRRRRSPVIASRQAARPARRDPGALRITRRGSALRSGHDHDSGGLAPCSLLD
ncbi:hypothetical protein LG3211_0162 [Lysobacter gummosus]|nr:hypothetical protein LG3211_0162 [Lysobacter gummosus]